MGVMPVPPEGCMMHSDYSIFGVITDRKKKLTSYHANIFDLALVPVVLRNGTLHIEGVTGLQVVNVLAHLAFRINFDNQVNVALCLYVRDL